MNETLKTILIALLSGGVCATLLKLIGDNLSWNRKRKVLKKEKAVSDAEKEESEWRKDMERKNDIQSEALKFILYDRIRYLAFAYIKDNEIKFDDRRILNEMHRVYHEGLGGNGDLDALMNSVKKLPLKK